MKEHELKCWPEYFEQVYNGLKNWELRKNDRDYKVGDVVVLLSFDDTTKRFTGSFVKAIIMYILSDAENFGLLPGYCILSLDRIEQGFDPEYAS